jgi:hypothetical protein
MMTSAAFVTDEGNCDKCEHYDHDDALFVFRELKNPEQAFHFPLGGLKVVILSGAKNLRSLFVRARETLARDVSLCST